MRGVLGKMGKMEAAKRWMRLAGLGKLSAFTISEVTRWCRFGQAGPRVKFKEAPPHRREPHWA